MLRTAIRLFLEESEKMGTLEEILSEVNYTVNHDGRYGTAKNHCGRRSQSLINAKDCPDPGEESYVRSSSMPVIPAGELKAIIMFFQSPVRNAPLVIPDWDDVPVFIIKNNLKSAGISREEYFLLLEDT